MSNNNRIRKFFMGNKLDQDDFVAAGFERLDNAAIEQRPPKINWGQLYRDKPMEERLAYAEKLASTMNQAAAKIQRERDELGKLCEKKEQQLQAMSKAIAQNNAMLQAEVTRMNRDKQEILAESTRMRVELRSLKKKQET